MTEQEQRICIAEACGYVLVPSHDEYGKAVPDSWEKDGDHYWDYELPDYLHDLNAMATAESFADEKYVDALENVVQNLMLTTEWPEGGDLYYWTIRASAAHRAEAFLRTIGKWKDA